MKNNIVLSILFIFSIIRLLLCINLDTLYNNEFECMNTDGDSCDDCASGTYNPDDDGCTYSAGDVSLDGAINILDVVLLVSIIVGEIEPTSAQSSVADMNNDGFINVSDIVVLIAIIMS